MEQLELPLVYAKEEVTVDGIVDPTGYIRYIGKATRQPNGKWHCLAQVGSALCIVEVRIRYLHSSKPEVIT